MNLQWTPEFSSLSLEAKLPAVKMASLCEVTHSVYYSHQGINRKHPNNMPSMQDSFFEGTNFYFSMSAIWAIRLFKFFQ